MSINKIICGQSKVGEMIETINGLIDVSSQKAMPDNDFNKAIETGVYLGFGDGAGGLSSAGAPVGSGNVRFVVNTVVQENVVFQSAVAGNANRGLFYYRSSYFSTDIEAALTASKWNALPTLNSPNTFVDEPSSANSMINLEHYANGDGGNSQTYGLDIHNNPDAKSALVVHQYSNDTPAVWLDNTDNQPMIRINNTHNSVRNPTGPATSEGDFLELKTEGLTKFRLRHDYVFQADGVKPTFFGSTNGFPALNIQTPNGNLTDTLQIIRANATNNGSAISVECAGGNGLKVNQSGAGLAAYIQSNQDSDTVQIVKTSSGVGEVLQLRNSGTGDSLRIESSGGSKVFGIGADGLISFASGNEQVTVGASGAASAVPAQPNRYIKVKASDGTELVIPAFLAV